MKLRNKVLITVSITWMFILAVTYAGSFLIGFETSLFFLTSFIILGITCSALIIFVFHYLLLTRIENLNSTIANINSSQNFRERIQLQNIDELSNLSSEINNMLNIIQYSHENLEERVRARTEQLLECNRLLQKEISDRHGIEKELIRHKENLTQLAHYDNLTSLPNRVFFNEILNKALNHAHHQCQTFAVLFIDLDRFKKINDACGHLVGDLVLKEVTKRFSNLLRAGDILARFGGDEFIILLNDISHPKFVSPVAEKLIQAGSKPIHVNNQDFYLTASIGISIYPNDGKSLEDLQRNADLAMYKSKRSGGSVYNYYSKEMKLEAHQYIQLESALQQALQNKEFLLHYQPKMNIHTGEIIGVEALIRWENPELGLVGPDKFLPLAEETGLILEIGKWVLFEACRVNKAWQDKGYNPTSISVNLSANQFQHQDIVHIVKQALQETGLNPKYLELEITEIGVTNNAGNAVEKLQAIKSLGVMISVDDFGTGYTSINYLKQFPIDIIKIDKNFIKGLPFNVNDSAITRAVIAMAHHFGLQVVAEGVENLEQLQFLSEHDCDIIQGYYISRPLPENKIILQLNKIGDITFDTLS